MEQVQLFNETVKYNAVKQKQQVKLFLMSYCSVCDFLENYNATVDRKELWIAKLKSVPSDTLFSVDNEPVGFSVNNFCEEDSDEEIIAELEKSKKLMEQYILSVPEIERAIVILQLFTQKSRDVIADIFDSKITPPKERCAIIDETGVNKHLLKFLNVDTITATEMSQRTCDRKYKHGLKDFVSVAKYVAEWYPVEMFRGYQVTKQFTRGVI